MHNQIPGQGSLFEEDYLLRTLGTISNIPHVALTELVANAWDAGASNVRITIPSKTHEELIIEDDGTGMTSEQFRNRWMTLAYDRIKHQGVYVEFPPERKSTKRRAYGRNGVGRHGMLCFANSYTVETWRDGICSKFIVSTSHGKDPFIILSEDTFLRDGHGTKLVAIVEKNLPDSGKIRDVLSARFLFDPEFDIKVNGISVDLEEHKGIVDRKTLKVTDNITLEVYVIDSLKTSRRSAQQHGIAFWVGRRLVGEPIWAVGTHIIEDGRTRFAKRHTIVVKTDDLFNEVLSDWTGFKYTPIVEQVANVLDEYIKDIKRKHLSERIQETQISVLQENAEDLAELKLPGRYEVSRFVQDITHRQPDISPETLAVAVEAIINIEKSRSGVSLLQKLSKLSEEDIDTLNRILDDWSVHDVMTVLEEIERRITVIEALERLSSDKDVDELKTLHPLVTQARWLFGPEFDSPMYSSNVSLRNAVAKLFGKKADKKAFINYKNRPDIVVLDDSTLSAVCTEEHDESSGLYKMRNILIIEVKRGGFEIGRQELNQANGYVEDIYNCGVIDGAPFINAYVVGHEFDTRIARIRKVADENGKDYGQITVCTYGQLIRTASRRLFNLREQLTERYKSYSEEDIVQKALKGSVQIKMNIDEASAS